MAYKGNWATGELIDATAFQELVNSAVYSFADLSTIQSSITSAVDGQIAYAQDTESYYRYDSDSSSWVALLGGADITAVTVNTNSDSGLAGGSTATSGDFTASLTIDPSNLADGSGITVDTSADFLILEDSTDGTVYKVYPSQIASGSANALEDGDSDLTITDGLTNGLDYDLDNTDVATWNNAGVQLTADGGIYHNALTQNQSFTVASTSGAMCVGALNIVGTITVAGNLVVL